MASYVLGRRVPDEFNTVVKVKAQQRKLGVEADGIWGPKTESAYQESLKAAQHPLTMGGLRLVERSLQPKSITDYVATYDGQRQRDWTDAELSNMGISNSNLPKVVNPEKLVQSDKALSKAYAPRNVMLNKLAQDDPALANPYMPELKYFKPINDVAFVESDNGTFMIDGKKYFPANSPETVSLDRPNNTIDYKFENEILPELLNNAMPEKYLSGAPNIPYVFRESHSGKDMDQKKNLNYNTLYLFNGKLYNKNEAGNIVWGAAMHKLGFSLEFTLLSANAGAYVLNKRPDEPYDLAAIMVGWYYMNNRRPNYE